MKSISLIFSLSVLFFMAACQSGNTVQSDSAKEAVSKVVSPTKTTKVANHIEVIDFYGTHRCETCKAIEANSRYTIDTYFAEALKEGKITFTVINADEEQNAEIAEKFEATGTALFLNVIKDGNETIMELTEFAFAKGRDQEAFSAELKSKIEEQLKTL